MTQSDANAIGTIELTTAPDGGILWVIPAAIYAVQREPVDDFTLVKTISDSLTVQETPAEIARLVRAYHQFTIENEEAELTRKLEHQRTMEIIEDSWRISHEEDQRQLKSSLLRQLRSERYAPEIYAELGLRFITKVPNPDPERVDLVLMERVPTMPVDTHPTLFDADPSESVSEVFSQADYDHMMGVDPDDYDG